MATITFDRALAFHYDDINVNHEAMGEFYESLPYLNKPSLDDCSIHLSAGLYVGAGSINIVGQYFSKPEDAQKVDPIAPPSDIVLFLGNVAAAAVGDNPSTWIRHELVHYAQSNFDLNSFSKPGSRGFYVNNSLKIYLQKLRTPRVSLTDIAHAKGRKYYDKYLSHEHEQEAFSLQKYGGKILELSGSVFSGYQTPYIVPKGAKSSRRFRTRHRNLALNVAGEPTLYQMFQEDFLQTQMYDEDL